jgi:hypothetical protein
MNMMFGCAVGVAKLVSPFESSSASVPLPVFLMRLHFALQEHPLAIVLWSYKRITSTRDASFEDPELELFGIT